MVPFDKYSKAAHSLVTPSSAARALNSGVIDIERVDKFVMELGKQIGKNNAKVNSNVELVNMWLEKNQNLNLAIKRLIIFLSLSKKLMT